MNKTLIERDEYVTIIAPTAMQAMAQFKERGLDIQGYSIAGKIGQHEFAVIQSDGTTQVFDHRGMVAATFRRRIVA